MKNKIVKYIKSLPTVRKLKTEIKHLNEKIEKQVDFIVQLESKISDLSDDDTKIATIKRLNEVHQHDKETIHYLRTEVNKYKEKLKATK